MSAGRELLESAARRHIDKWIAQVVARALPENAPAVLIAQLNERASVAAFHAMMQHIDAAPYNRSRSLNARHDDGP